MNISDKITKSDFQNLLLKIHQKEHETKEVEVLEVINEIKENILLICCSDRNAK